MKRAIVWKRAARVFGLVLAVMFVVAFWGIITVARNLASAPSGSADFSLLGLQMFVGTKNGNVSTLSLQVGVVLVVVLPALAAALTAALSMLSNRRGGARREPMPNGS